MTEGSLRRVAAARPKDLPMAFRYVHKTIGKLALAAATQVEHGSHTPSQKATGPEREENPPRRRRDHREEPQCADEHGFAFILCVPCVSVVKTGLGV